MLEAGCHARQRAQRRARPGRRCRRCNVYDLHGHDGSRRSPPPTSVCARSRREDGVRRRGRVRGRYCPAHRSSRPELRRCGRRGVLHPGRARRAAVSDRRQRRPRPVQRDDDAYSRARQVRRRDRRPEPRRRTRPAHCKRPVPRQRGGHRRARGRPRAHRQRKLRMGRHLGRGRRRTRRRALRRQRGPRVLDALARAGAQEVSSTPRSASATARPSGRRHRCGRRRRQHQSVLDLCIVVTGDNAAFKCFIESEPVDVFETTRRTPTKPASAET